MLQFRLFRDKKLFFDLQIANPRCDRDRMETKYWVKKKKNPQFVRVTFQTPGKRASKQ